MFYEICLFIVFSYNSYGVGVFNGNAAPPRKPQKRPKMPKNGQKWAKKAKKWPKNAKIHPFLTPFWGVLSQIRLWRVFFPIPRKPGFRIGVPEIPANLDSL